MRICKTVQRIVSFSFWVTFVLSFLFCYLCFQNLVSSIAECLFVLWCLHFFHFMTDLAEILINLLFSDVNILSSSVMRFCGQRKLVKNFFVACDNFLVHFSRRWDCVFSKVSDYFCDVSIVVLTEPERTAYSGKCLPVKFSIHFLRILQNSDRSIKVTDSGPFKRFWNSRRAVLPRLCYQHFPRARFSTCPVETF